MGRPSRTNRSTSKTSKVKLSEVARELVVPEGIVTSGWPDVKHAAEAFLGIEFDGWQDGVGRLVFGKRKDGLYAASVGGVVLSIPRQVGKTFLLGSLVFAMCLRQPGLTVIWTAHRGRTSAETFQSMQALAARSKVKPRVKGVRRTTGEEAILFENGARILFGARESGFGRGFSEVDVLVLDEAQILTEKTIEDMVPATNQSDNPLIFMIGTPPRPIDPGDVFRGRRRSALSGKSKDTLYVEFSADPDADIDDRKQWAKANPSFPKRTPVAAMLRMRELLENDDSFLREALGIWDEDTQVPALIRPSWWLKTNVEVLPEGGLVSFGVRFSADGARLALSAAANYGVEEPVGVELIRAEPMTVGWKWALDFLVKRKDTLSMIVIDGKGDAAGFERDLRNAGVPLAAINFGKGTLTSMLAADAYAGFMGAVRDGHVRHTGDEALTESVKGSQRRKIGTQGAFGFGPIRPTDDSSLVESAALAWYAAHLSKRKPSGQRRRTGALVM